MGIEGRAELTFELCEDLRSITREGILYRHPNYTEQQVTQAYLKLILNSAVFEQIFPCCGVEP